MAEIELAIKESRCYWREDQAEVLDELRKHSIKWPKDASSVTTEWLGGELGNIPRGAAEDGTRDGYYDDPRRLLRLLLGDRPPGVQ